MSTFEEAVEYLFVLEGHLSNHPDDPGGLTAYGITRRDHPDLFIRGQVPNRQEAEDRYRRDYWREEWTELPQSIANELLEASVLCGPANAAKFAQQGANNLRVASALQLDVDGRYGPITHKTLKHIAENYELALFASMNLEQGTHFKRINNPAFMRGWISKRLGYSL